MCGRYSLTTPGDHLVEVFGVPPVTFDYRARYNIAPSQDVPVVASDTRGIRLDCYVGASCPLGPTLPPPVRE